METDYTGFSLISVFAGAQAGSSQNQCNPECGGNELQAGFTSQSGAPGA
jgi:hypothetical protein